MRHDNWTRALENAVGEPDAGFDGGSKEDLDIGPLKLGLRFVIHPEGSQYPEGSEAHAQRVTHHGYVREGLNAHGG